MNRLQTSWTIFKNSVELIKQHKKLTLFPLLNFFGFIGIISFFVLPIFFDVTIFNIWTQYPEAFEAWQVDMEESIDTQGTSGSIFGFFPMLVIYFISMFLVTFINVAFYHEILRAFNGEEVKISRGLAFSVSKLRAILMWSLLAGLVGTIIRQIEENVGLIGRWIVGLVGITWSIASVFTIPVIIREEQQHNPIAYLKTSAGLIKKTWGEGLIGLISISLLVWLLVFPTLILGLVISVVASNFIFMAVACLAVFILLYLAGVAKKIFFCGLYVYATEGVAPGAFDQSVFDNAWKVKKNK